MFYWTLSAAIAAVSSGSSSGSASLAQGLASGIYEKDEKRSENAFKAIDDATADLSSDKRPLARARLRKSIAVNRIRISIAGDRIGIAYDAKAPIVAWLGGEPVTWKLTDGFVFAVSAKASGEDVSITFRDADSARITTYRSVGRDLVEDTTITGPALSTPIVYRQVFNRAN